MNERAIPAESVGELLEMARLRQLSGRLTIRQQSRGSSMEGEVSLRAGRPVSARLGSMAGQEALTRLVGWRSVQYMFQPDEPGAAPLVSRVVMAKTRHPFLGHLIAIR